MSKNLNNFWDDCIDDKNLELNIMLNSKNPLSSNSNRTKQSTLTSNNNEMLLVSSNKKLNKNNNTNYRNNNRILNQKKFYYKTKEFMEKHPSCKVIKNKKRSNKNIKEIANLSCCRNKLKSNYVSSEEKNLKKNLSECTFHPKITSNIRNKNLKEKLLNYSKFTMYERGQIFEMKKKEDGQLKYRELIKKKNKKYPYKPEIHKCPTFRNVIFNDSNYDSLSYFYSRMNSAREKKINKNKKMPFNLINYEEIYNNNSSYFNKSICCNNTRFKKIKYIVNKKGNIHIPRNQSHSSLMIKILNDKETEIYKKNLHKALMELELYQK